MGYLGQGPPLFFILYILIQAHPDCFIYIIVEADPRKPVLADLPQANAAAAQLRLDEGGASLLSCTPF